jgi:hypothetical protein
MQIETIKNQETVIFACSGPSLNNVDVFSLGLPVVAISTTIRKIPNPHIWLYSDYLNEMHGEEGKKAYLDENILKVIQEGKTMNHLSGKNLHPYQCANSNRNFKINTDLFDFSKPFARGPHKSITFGIQWAHSIGIKNIIFAGNDLKAESMETKYCYPLQQFDIKKKHNFKRTLDEVKNTLIEWYPIAKQKGYNWYSWQCGSEFDNVVEKLTPELIEKFKQSSVKQPINLIPTVDVKDIDLSKETYSIVEEQYMSEKQKAKQKIDTYLEMMRQIKKI